MSNVVRLPKLIAWVPTPEDIEPAWRDSAVSLSAILCPPGEMLCRDLYLSYLGDRIQRMINLCDDPREATETLRQDLFDAGLYLDECRVPPDEAGNRLIWSNDLGVGYRLGQWGLLPTGDTKTHEMPAAREVLMGERYDPEDHLRSWVGLLSRLP